MDTQAIITIIQKRRETFWERQSIGVGEAAQLARDIADEYNYLLAEVEEAIRG
jgi:hypothetical protein